MAELQTVCVYCASSPRTKPEHLAVARELGNALAEAGLTLLYGGGAVGMMGAVADASLAAGGTVVGVRPEFISDLEEPHPEVAEMIFTETMHERKHILTERADAFVTLPGAIGTLDELIEILTWKRLGLHNKPICILNTGGFFDPILAQFQRMVDEDLVAPRFLDLFSAPVDVAGAIEYLSQHRPSEAKPVLWADDAKPAAERR